MTNNQNDRIERLIEAIDRLIAALYHEIPNLKADINGAVEESRETRRVLDDKFERLTATVERQAETAQTQADSIRQLIEMLNRRQA